MPVSPGEDIPNLFDLKCKRGLSHFQLGARGFLVFSLWISLKFLFVGAALAEVLPQRWDANSSLWCERPRSESQDCRISR